MKHHAEPRRDLVGQIRASAEPLRRPTRIARWLFAAAAFVALVTAAALFVAISGTHVAPPDIDSPPGIFGSLELDVSPENTAVRIDDGPPQRAHLTLTIRRLDPNRPHHLEVSAPGFLPFDGYVVVPANGVRRERVTLRPAGGVQ